MFPEFNVSNTKPKFLGVTNKYTSNRRPSYSKTDVQTLLANAHSYLPFQTGPICTLQTTSIAVSQFKLRPPSFPGLRGLQLQGVRRAGPRQGIKTLMNDLSRDVLGCTGGAKMTVLLMES